MKIVLAGGGEIGLQLATALAGQNDIHVIDHDPDAAADFERLDVQPVIGPASDVNTLRRAHADEADIFIACTGTDEVNIISCLAARELGKARTICFVTREEYFSSFSAGNLGAALSIDRLVWPAQLLAEQIVRTISVPEAIDVEVFAAGRVRLLEYRLKEENKLDGVPLAKMGLPAGVIAVAVVRNERLFIPSGKTKVKTGDKIMFMGQGDAMREVEARFRPQNRRMRDVVVVGGGTVGLMVARALENEEIDSIRLIEAAQDRCERISMELGRTLVLNGDGTDLELLESEEIGRTDCLVSVTDNDEKNLLGSLLARQLGVGKVITRVNKQRNVKLFEKVGVDVAINSRSAAIRDIVHSLQFQDVNLLASLEGGQGEVIEIAVSATFKRRHVRELELPEGVVLGALLRGRSTLIPGGDTEVISGDHLLAFCTPGTETQVRELFQ